jgi:hypothetical protein
MLHQSILGNSSRVTRDWIRNVSHQATTYDLVVAGHKAEWTTMACTSHELCVERCGGWLPAIQIPDSPQLHGRNHSPVGRGGPSGCHLPAQGRTHRRWVKTDGGAATEISGPGDGLRLESFSVWHAYEKLSSSAAFNSVWKISERARDGVATRLTRTTRTRRARCPFSCSKQANAIRFLTPRVQNPRLARTPRISRPGRPTGRVCCLFPPASCHTARGRHVCSSRPAFPQGWMVG